MQDGARAPGQRRPTALQGARGVLSGVLGGAKEGYNLLLLAFAAAELPEAPLQRNTARLQLLLPPALCPLPT